MILTNQSAWRSLIRVVGILAPWAPALAICADLKDYPTAPRIWLGYAQGDLGATRQEPIMAEGSGIVRILKNHDSSVKKGELLLIFRPERLEIERETLSLQRQTLNYQIEDTRTAREEKISALEGQKADLEMTIQQLKTASGTSGLVKSAAMRKQIQDAINASNKKLVRIKARFDLMRQENTLEVDVRQLRLDQQRRELDFESTRRNAERAAPFDGHFALATEMISEHSAKLAPYEFWAKPGDLLGHLTDHSSYDITIRDYPAILNQAPPEDLVLEMQARNGKDPLIANFMIADQTPTTGRGGKTSRTLVFRIRPEDKARAESITGSTTYGQIFQLLPAGCHIVPKTDLLKHLKNNAPGAGGWEAQVQAIWPNVKVVAIGHLALALLAPNAEATPLGATQ